MFTIARPLTAILVGLLALSACSTSADGNPTAAGQGSDVDDSAAIPDPVECELGVATIKEKVVNATPRVSEGGPTDSCAWQSGTKRQPLPCLVTVFGDPSEEFTTMDEAKAKDDGDNTYRKVPEIDPEAWLEHRYTTTVHWPTKHLVIQVSSDNLTEADVIDIATAVNDDLAKLGE